MEDLGKHLIVEDTHLILAIVISYFSRCVVNYMMATLKVDNSSNPDILI